MEQSKKAHLPIFLKPYFWDVAFEELEVKKDTLFIMKRVLDRGNTQALRWVLSMYDKATIKTLILFSKDISPKTANFWAEMLDLDKTKIPCLQKPYSPIHFRLFS